MIEGCLRELRSVRSFITEEILFFDITLKIEGLYYLNLDMTLRANKVLFFLLLTFHTLPNPPLPKISMNSKL